MSDEQQPYVPAESTMAELTVKAVVLGVVLAAIRRHVPEMLSRVMTDDETGGSIANHNANGRADWRLRAA